MITENKLNLSNIPSIEEISDAAAESFNAGAFRFAVSPANGPSTVAEYDETTASGFGVLRWMSRIRLNDTDGSGGSFAVAIHDTRTGDNLVQIRSARNPARHGELINIRHIVRGVIEQNPGARLEFRIRQFGEPGITPTPTPSNDDQVCFFGCNSIYASTNFTG